MGLIAQVVIPLRAMLAAMGKFTTLLAPQVINKRSQKFALAQQQLPKLLVSSHLKNKILQGRQSKTASDRAPSLQRSRSF
jgi:hypothetical protein